MPGLTLEQLITEKTKEEWREQLLTAFKGIGFVSKASAGGTGSLSVSGVAAAEYSVAVKVTTAGELGTGAFAVSTDGGTTYGAPVTIPGGATYVIPSTGATVTFAAGPTGSGTSFLVGDTYSFELTIPTLPVTSWREGDTALVMTELVAQVAEEFSKAQLALAKGGFLLHAEDDWLDLWVSNVYSLTRGQGGTTLGTVTLTNGSSTPRSIAAGQLWFGTASGLRYVNTTGGTLAASGGTLSVTVRAEGIGSRYNVAAGTITRMLVTLAGVTVNNPNPVGGSWITTSGSDRESDAALVVRAQARWPALGAAQTDNATDRVYDLWSKTADASVTRTSAKARTGAGAGTIDLRLGSAAGGVSGGVVTAVQSYVDKRTGLCIDVVVASASTVASTVSGNVYVQRGYADSVEAAIQTNLERLYAESPIATAAGETIIRRSNIIEELSTPTGVAYVDLATLLPAADVTANAGEVATLTNSITVVEL